MALEFLKPVSADIYQFAINLSPHQLGTKVVFHTNIDFPDLKKIKIAIVGVLENRGFKEVGNKIDLTNIRKEFYKLYLGNWDGSLADLGDIEAGERIEDTYFAINKLVTALIKQNVIPIIIGGSQDLSYPIYRSFDDLDQMVNLVSIDRKFDFGKQDIDLSSESYLSRIIIDQPNNLYNYSNIGYQTYYNSQDEIDLLEKLYFDAFRLGDVCKDISITEPVFRDADFVSLDLSSVKSADSGNFKDFFPNGLSGKELCALSRYSGISDKVSVFGIFNFIDNKNEAVLISQVMWYFIEGFHQRSNEYPFGDKKNFIKYNVTVEDDIIIFYKSDKTDRWWIEVPFFSNTNNNNKKNTLLPCTYQDYLGACNQEIPERWWKARRKNRI